MAETEHANAAPTKSAGAEPAILTACALAWLGVQVCFLLLQKSAGIRSLFCSSQAGCDAVTASKYSAFLGIPLPWIGATLYLLLLALSLAAYAARTTAVRKNLLGILVWLSIAGVSFSAALMYVQFGILRAFCPLCTASALVMLGLALVLLRAERRAAAPFVGARSAAVALAVVAAISTIFQLISTLPSSEEVVAVVNGQQFTRSQMEQELGAPRQSLTQDIHKLEAAWVTSQVDAALLSAEAKRRGVSVAELISTKEIKLERTGITESDPARRELAISQLVGEIAGRHRVEINLKKPPLKYLRSDLSTAHLAGPRDAPVQLVVFSDFQCEICARLAPVLERVRKDFSREVLLAYRHFPLEPHSRAVPAAMAAECAAEQGAFWQYHDKLFAEGGDLSDAKLREIAVAVGLDAERFRQCLGTDKARMTVETSYRDAVASGLDGAPSLLLDGTLIGGFIDYDTLASLVRKRLQLAGDQR